MQIGDIVRVKAPFNEFWPGEWPIVSVNPDTGAFQIDGGVDFAEEHLELVEDGNVDFDS
jgi:hypothetical protein